MQEFRGRGASFGVQALGWLVDFDLECRGEISECLSKVAKEIWAAFPSSIEAWWECDSFTDFSMYLRGLAADNLGSSGSRFLLKLMGAAETPANFCERALQCIERFDQERDWREDPGCVRFGGPALHKRVFSYAEYRFGGVTEGGSFMEGAILQENSAPSERLVSRPRWFRAIDLPVNFVVDRTMCTEFLLLSELVGLLAQEGLTPEKLKILSGMLRLYATGPPCVSCISVLRQVQLLLPRVTLQVSYGRSQVFR